MKFNYHLIFIIALFYFITSCSSESIVKDESPIIVNQPKTDTLIIFNNPPKKPNIKLGIDILKENNFEILKNKKVGLITNQTGVDSKLNSTIDILFNAKNVKLVSLFGPEHGVRGDVDAGKYVEFYNDPKTKLPVYSLYGKTRKPSKEMLKGIDVLVYDIQDVGVRSYTFISTMGLAMEAASENNIEFVVLDRPNPLGGIKVEGNVLEEEYKSFISQYPIPYVYGLTCGELAKMLVDEKMISTKPGFNVKVIAMFGWIREMTFAETNLHWIPTSPHIPNEGSAMFYPMTGILGELRDAISIGVGYTLPFEIIGAEWIDGIKFTDELNKQNIPGLFFRPITFQPYYAFGKGKVLHGAQIYIDDYSKVNLTNTQFYIIDTIQKLYPKKDIFTLADKNQIGMFNKALGTAKISKMISENKSLDNILDFLDKDTASFKKLSQKYYLYN